MKDDIWFYSLPCGYKVFSAPFIVDVAIFSPAQAFDTLVEVCVCICIVCSFLLVHMAVFVPLPAIWLCYCGSVELIEIRYCGSRTVLLQTLSYQNELGSGGACL